MESWREITDFPDYAVSDLGRVMRIVDSKCGSTAGSTLSLSPYKNGYSMVHLWNGDTRAKIYVHDLVLSAFAGLRPNGHVCNHKDSNRANNNIANLEWVTQSANVKHCYDSGRREPIIMRGENNGNSKLKDGEIWLIKKLLASGIVTQKNIGRMFRVTQAQVSLIKTGIRGSHVSYP